MDPHDLRADIPALDDGTVYLNTGASGPATGRALAAAREAQRAHEVEAHRGNPYPYAYDAYDDARAAIGDFLGAPAEEIALTNSTADGISRIANAVDWEAGDAVVRTDLEHPAGTLPWARLGPDGVETRVVACPDGRLDREAYAEAVRGARLVCLSSLSWLHGTRLPVRDAVEIAHDAGALVLVDAVQSVGHHPVDVGEWGADAVAAGGHKWLLGVWGSGFLHVRDPGRFEPRHFGYRAVDSYGGGDGVDYHDGAARFEVGTASLAPHAALREAMSITREVGLGAIRDRMASLTDRLKEGLGDRLVSPREFESGLVAFSVDAPERTVDALADRGIHVRTVENGPETLVRASVHAFNTADDIDALLDGIEAVGG